MTKPRCTFGIRHFLVALAFLTVLPVRFRVPPSPEAVARSRWWFPVVGILLGTLLGTLAAVLAAWMPSSPLGALLVLLAWVSLTGALHVDGFCDLCDGLFGGHKPEERLRIMKDPHVGTFGLAGGVLLLLGKFVAVEAALRTQQGPWMVGGAVTVARCLALCVAAGSRYPRPEGAGKALIEATRAWEAWLFAAVAALAILLTVALPRLPDHGWLSRVELLPALALFSAPFFAVMVLKWLCRRRLEGITGDCLGAAIETAEVIFLVTAAMVPTVC